MDDHSRRLVDDQDVVVLEYDVERNLLRFHRPPSGRRHVDQDDFADPRPVARPFAPTRDGHVASAIRVAAWLRDTSRLAAMSRSRRGASAGAFQCGCGAQATLVQPIASPARASAAAIAGILLPEHARQHHRADRHRRIGDVERPEPHVADADVDEVDDAARRAKSIDQISRGAAPTSRAPARARSPRRLVPRSCCCDRVATG